MANNVKEIAKAPSPTPSTDRKKGGCKVRSMTELQKHVCFFDTNGDGIVYPWETYAGLHAIGFGVPFSALLAIVINVALSYLSLPTVIREGIDERRGSWNNGWIPSLLFPIYIRNIYKGKHGSDTDIYDKQGWFVATNLDKMFSEYAHTSPNRITLKEIWKMTEDNREAYDFIGWILAKAEWLLLYFLAKDKDGFLSKEAVEGCFDGTLFEYLAKNHSKRD